MHCAPDQTCKQCLTMFDDVTDVTDEVFWTSIVDNMSKCLVSKDHRYVVAAFLSDEAIEAASSEYCTLHFEHSNVKHNFHVCCAPCYLQDPGPAPEITFDLCLPVPQCPPVRSVHTAKCCRYISHSSLQKQASLLPSNLPAADTLLPPPPRGK